MTPIATKATLTHCAHRMTRLHHCAHCLAWYARRDTYLVRLAQPPTQSQLRAAWVGDCWDTLHGWAQRLRREYERIR